MTSLDRRTDYRREGADPWWENPLALATAYCADCGTPLDSANRPCPFGPHEETQP